MSVGTFNVDITLGNAAMLTGDDVALALDTIARRVETGAVDGRILDVNGASVGKWTLRDVVEQLDGDVCGDCGGPPNDHSDVEDHEVQS